MLTYCTLVMNQEFWKSIESLFLFKLFKRTIDEKYIISRPECPAPDNIYQMTSNPEDWPNKADLLKIEFKKGLLVFNLLKKTLYG